MSHSRRRIAAFSAPGAKRDSGTVENFPRPERTRRSSPLGPSQHRTVPSSWLLYGAQARSDTSSAGTGILNIFPATSAVHTKEEEAYMPGHRKKSRGSRVWTGRRATDQTNTPAICRHNRELTHEILKRRLYYICITHTYQ